MAEDQAEATLKTTLKACKALTITDTISYVRPAHLRLLNLPREVRDEIWHLVLAEPRKWDRRHGPGCPHRDTNAPFERLTHRVSRSPKKIHSWETVDPSAIQCRDLCITRDSLGLLQVNRQIFEETEPIFWENNTFCFDSPGRFIYQIRDIPTAALFKIRKVSVGTRESDRMEFYTNREMCRILRKLKSLTEVEIPTYSVRYLMMDDLCFPPYLRKIHCTSSKQMKWGLENKRIVIDVAMTSSFDILELSAKEYSSCGIMSLFSDFCSHCHGIYRSVRDEVAQLQPVDYLGDPRWSAKAESDVQDMILHRQGFDAPFNPYIYLLHRRDGLPAQEVSVWGLPVSIKEKRRAALECRADSIANLSKSRLTDMYISDDEDKLLMSKRAKNWHYQQQQQKILTEKKMEQRLTVREMEARHENARQKSAQKKAVKAKAKAEAEAVSDRKAARKRSGR